MTREGGGFSQEGADGKTLFHLHMRWSAPLVVVSLPGGAKRTIIDCVPRFGMALGVAGIYHEACGSGSLRPLYLLDLATGRDRLLGTLDHPGAGLTVSADGKTILYTKAVAEGSDLVMIENFR